MEGTAAHVSLLGVRLFVGCPRLAPAASTRSASTAGTLGWLLNMCAVRTVEVVEVAFLACSALSFSVLICFKM